MTHFSSHRHTKDQDRIKVETSEFQELNTNIASLQELQTGFKVILQVTGQLWPGSS